MFLALKELNYAKLRYLLVTGLILLIAYLVFFLTGLAFGLAQANRTAIDSWHADAIVLTEESDKNLNMSRFDIKTLDDIRADDKASLLQTGAVIINKKNKFRVNLMGINRKQFITPKLSEGKSFINDFEAVVDQSLQEEYDVQIGDRLTISATDHKIKVVGFTKNQKFNVSPVFYMSTQDVQDILNEMNGYNEMNFISAVLIRGQVQTLPDNLEKISIQSFIQELPGYQAQVLTFVFMIGFLIIIAAVVIGIFIYILTLQKTEIFGVMKAQGISNAYIGQSVVFQTFILAITGVMVGFCLTLLSYYLLPKSVPFEINWALYGVIGLLMILMAILGAIFSVRSIVKIDPLKAIG